MKIEIWSDIACPYCYVGSENFENALKQFGHKEEIEIVMHSFELEPNIRPNTGEPQHQAVMRKYHQTSGQAQHTLDVAAQAGKQAGIKIDFDKVITTNTFDAHRLIKFAKANGKASEIKNALFKAYFSDGRHIGNKEQLIEIAAENGLEAEAMLESDAYFHEVRKDEAFAQQLGVNSVPYFRLNGRHVITGARPVHVFVQILEQLWNEEMAITNAAENTTAGCEGGACNI